MRVVCANRTMDVAMEHGRSSIRLEGGVAYVMHDVEARGGVEAGVFDTPGLLPPVPAPYDPTAPTVGRMILPFIGGMGDAISMLPILATLRARDPGAVLEIATTEGPSQVFELCPCVDHVRSYPLTLAGWGEHDRYLSMELVHETGQVPGRPLPEVFADAIGLELTDRSFPIRIPKIDCAIVAGSDVPPLVGIAVGEEASLRAYPRASLLALLEELVGHGFACVLFGSDGGGGPIPENPPLVTDMRSKTRTVLELAVWLREMTVVIAHDSFIMHLAGALGKPTVALFAPTAAAHASPYVAVSTARSATPCAPCHEIGTACPRGFDRCIAWDDAAVAPTAIAEATEALVLVAT